MKSYERVRYIRKKLNGLTMDEFGRRLGVGKTAISKIESGENALTDQMCRSICREFRINEAWLRDGIGPIEIEYPGSPIYDLIDEYHLDDVDVRLIEQYLKLTPEERTILKDYIRSAFLADDADEPASEEPLDVAAEEQAYAKRSGSAMEDASSVSSTGSEDAVV